MTEVRFARMPVWVLAPDGVRPAWECVQSRWRGMEPPMIPAWAGKDALWVPGLLVPEPAPEDLAQGEKPSTVDAPPAQRLVTGRIPFLDRFHAAVREGRKTCTARTKTYGRPGDRLHGAGVVLVLDEVGEMRLGEVATRYWREEGVGFPGEFIRIWEQLHPTKGYDPEQVVFLHRFHVDGGPPGRDAGSADAGGGPP